jgi:signal transduction histidine kinase
MLDAKPMSHSLNWEHWGKRAALILTIGYQIVALFAFIAASLLAIQQFTNPFYFVPLLVGATLLSSSVWVLTVRGRDTIGRIFAIFATSTALALVAFFDVQTTENLTLLWIFTPALASGALIHLGLVFPEETDTVVRYPLLRWGGYIPTFVLILHAIYTVTTSPDSGLTALAFRYEYAYLAVGGFFFLSMMAVQWQLSQSPLARAQVRLILWGAFASAFPFALWIIAVVIRPSAQFTPFLLLPFGIFPLVVSYAMLRYRVLRTDYLLSRAALYTLFSIMAALGYAFLVAGLTLIFGIPMAAINPFVVGFLVVILALLLNPVRNRLQQYIDTTFLRGESAYQERLQEFSHALTQTIELPEIIRILRRYIIQALLPAQLHIYVHHSLTDQYVPTLDERGHPTSDIRFPASSSLAQALTRRQSSYFLGTSVTQPRALHDDWARLSLLNAQLFVPIPGQPQLLGWIALGARRSGEPYTDRDLSFLEALGDQAALAIERTQVVANLERRVHQMNVLTRIAQGVNITLAFDDILELIYAQTNQVLPTHDFFITLFDENLQNTYHAFFLERNERLTDKENKPLPPRQGLASEVIETGRTLIVEDYERECRERAVIPIVRGVYAWLSVPLNTRDATIGALSLGSRDPAVVYTADQRDILQAIADQAAGAIAKARLLVETERRARQLAILNDVAQSLSSTLDLQPLLDRILHSAVELLDCEAGSLFSIDEGTGELVFEVTAGPVASDLLGQRLPPGTGLVGKSADTGEPIIVNDVKMSADWSDAPDQITGFVTRSILVVPLQVKDTTIGVLEVINKSDGSPFTEDEQELLTVFSGQAAVAIENARLYTLTDQALADRVEELSVMQRIDRELNASLDITRTLRITLDWAMRQSRSDSGLIGLMEENELQVLVSQGYGSVDGKFNASQWVEFTPSAKQALLSGSAQRIDQINDHEDGALLDEAQSQIAIPIRRETEVIGLLFLESTGRAHFSDENMRFLTRLSDHAAIAISNAQFYAEVQEANIAKSDFVSFVSHELKTPMTSIKGYADLLADGAVGPISDAQANFLSTIRSNVDRMATLVSDLADISRIEAGRLRLEFGAVPIAESVEEVVRSAKSLIEEKDQVLTLAIPDDLPQVWGDRTRLIQILTNLLSNAHKYTQNGGQIEIRAKQTENDWDPEGAPQVIHVMVQDSGIGISPDDQKKIFQKFFRSEDEKAREASGTGLGLNITKNLVEMQGGRIWFESEYRKGTTFHFTIPVVESA